MMRSVYMHAYQRCPLFGMSARLSLDETGYLLPVRRSDLGSVHPAGPRASAWLVPLLVVRRAGGGVAGMPGPVGRVL